MEVTLTQPRTYLEIQLNSGEITQNKQLNKSKRKASIPCTYGMSSNTTCPHLHNRTQEVGDRLTIGKTAAATDPPKKDPTRTKKQRNTQNQHKPHPKSLSSADQRDCTTESHRYSTTEVQTINPGGQNRAT